MDGPLLTWYRCSGTTISDKTQSQGEDPIYCGFLLSLLRNDTATSDIF
jgi:hypothetical protein